MVRISRSPWHLLSHTLGPQGNFGDSLGHMPFSALGINSALTKPLGRPGLGFSIPARSLLPEPGHPSHHIQLRGDAWAQVGQAAPEGHRTGQRGHYGQRWRGGSGTEQTRTHRTWSRLAEISRKRAAAKRAGTRAHRGRGLPARGERRRRRMRAHSRRPRAACSLPGWRLWLLEAGRPGRRRGPVGRQRPRSRKPRPVRPGLVSRGCLWHE